MEPPPPPPPPPTVLPIVAHLRSLLSAASAALSALPSPLTNSSSSTTASLPSPTPPLTTTTTALPALPSPPTSSIPIPLPASPAPYSDCPAVVSTSTPRPAASTLPAFLAAECADFPSPTRLATLSSPLRILPSELCLLRREVDSWSGHHLPDAYSHAVARVTAALQSVAPRWASELRRWVLTASSRYGVVIDAVTCEHVFVLLRLCLNAVAAEASCSLEQAQNRKDRGSCFYPRAVMFECPRLVGGVSWLGVQLGILYGEGTGRSFAVAAVREAMLQSGSYLAVGVGDVAVGGRGGDADVSGGGEENRIGLADGGGGPIFVSQVAAGIGALHERFSMEDKIRVLNAPKPSKHQLLLEYSLALERGHEERSKRPNYRAVLEYDGFLSRQPEGQESGRTKTREEILAEERDYKRRRISYRGKKAKRNPTEILRDIIDEHMEEIKQAGGIGCLVETPGDIPQHIFKSNSHGGSYQGSCDPTSSTYNRSNLCSQSPSCDFSSHPNSFGRVSLRSHDRRNSHRNLSYETRDHYDQNVNEHENRGFKESESATKGSYFDQNEKSRHHGNSNDHRKYGYKYNKDFSEYHSDSSDYITRSARTPKSSVTEYDCLSGDRNNDRNHHQHRSALNQDQFIDRGDPQSRY